MPDRAQIHDLHGKYYGTTISFDTGYAVVENTFWYADGSDPSDRQLENWNMTLEEARTDGMMSDSHYETKLTYLAAKALVDFLNIRVLA